MTRGQCGALLLHCTALSSATPCRLSPALSLRSPKSIQARFDEAVSKNYCLTGDRLRFFTLAIHVRESRKARTPGALFTKLLKNKSWSGSDAQEDVARKAIRELDRQPLNGHTVGLAAHLRADLPGGQNLE